MKTNDSCMENEHLVSLNREYFNTIQYDFTSHKNIVFKKKKNIHYDIITIAIYKTEK